MVRYKRILATTVGIGGILALSVGTGTLHAQAATATVTTLSCAPACGTSSVAGASVVLTAAIVPATQVPTGTVQFMDGTATLGSLQTVTAGTPTPNGTASLTTNFMSSGVHHLTAIYNGDTANTTSTSPNVNHTVTVGAPTQIAVTAAPPSINANQTTTKSTVTATIEDVGGNTVTTASTVLNFATTAGTMATPTATASSGVATDQLTASTSTLGGTDTVTVSATGLTSGSAPVSEVGTNTNLVNAAFTTMLGHNADAGGLSYWVGQLNAGAPRSMLAMALASTPEYRTSVISGAGGKDFYTLYLQRAFDPAGASYWAGRMAGANGMAPLSFEQVRLNFVGSPEFFNVTSGGSHATAIQNLYKSLLGRADGGASDTAGTNYWMANFNVNTIASQFLFSYEGRAFLVNGLYFKILTRTPADPLGLDFWTKALLAGASDENIIGNILGSDEYYNNHH